MKKSNENKTQNQKKSIHNVETPAPPQVMDPSALPARREADKGKSKKETQAVDKKKTPDEEKLAPNEEL